MANICQLSDGIESVDFYDRSFGGLADGGHDLGVPGASRRVIRLQARLFSTAGQLTLPQLEANLATIARLIDKAERTNGAGLRRQVVLTIQPQGMPVATRYYLTGGEVPPIAPFDTQYLVNHIYDDLPLTLYSEGWAYGPEAQILTSGNLFARHTLDVRFVATGATGTGVDGTPQGFNTAPLSRGLLTQNNKLTTVPVNQAMANSLAFYFGASLGTFDRLIFGLEAAKTGVWAGVWEYWNGTAWTSVATSSNFRSGAEGTEFDVAAKLGRVLLTGATPGWIAKAIVVGGVSLTCFWLRYRITSYTSGTAPSFQGPFRTLSGIVEIPAGSVAGAKEAAALVHLTNNSGNSLAGVRACIATGELASVPPPFVLDLSGADIYIPSGDTTVTLVTDFGANDNERIDLGLVQTIIERAQTFDGVAEYATYTPVATDKLGTLPDDGDFTFEVLFKADVVPSGPVPLISQWGSTASASTVWLGLDQGKLKGMIYKQNGQRKVVKGTTTIVPGTWVLAALVYVAGDEHLQIKRNGSNEATLKNIGSVSGGKTTPFRLAKSFGFSTSDSNSGSAQEGFFKGSIANVRVLANTPTTEHGGHYDWPAIGLAITNDSATTRWLLRMEDNAASLQITDSNALGPGGVKHAARSANFTNIRSTIGYFQPGAGQVAKVLGMNLPRCLAEEFRGRYRVYLRASPAATLANVNDIFFQLQLNVGDISLPMGEPAYFPSTAVPSGGYYVLDLGVFSLPPVGLRDTGPFGPLTSSRNVLQANLFVQHNFSVATTIRLDCLFMLPTGTWLGSYDSFRTQYDAAFDIDTSTGVLFDSLGPESIIGQTTLTGYTEPFRNPYADPGGSDPCRLIPGKPAWLFAIPLRGTDAVIDYEHHVLGDTLQPRVHAVGRYRALAVA